MPYPDDSLFPSASLWPEIGPGEGLQLEVFTDDPCPRVAITLDGLDPSGPSRVTLWRSAEGGKRRQVRGWSNRLVFGSDFGIDYEVPLGRPVRYDVQLISGAVTPDELTAYVQVDAEHGFVQDPLIPSGAVAVTGGEGGGTDTIPTLRSSAFSALQYEMGWNAAQILGSDTPVGLMGQRMVASGVDFSVFTDAAEQTTALRQVLRTAAPVLVRTLPAWGDLPDLMYLAASVTEEPLTVPWGGSLTHWVLSGDQVAPPSLNVLVPLWTYDDVQAVFDAYNYAYRQSLAVTAGASYLDDQQDPTLGA